jgi:predicted transcriptional regulator
MWTTISLDDALLAEAKHVAARTGRSLTAVVEDALRESLHRRHHIARRAVELPTFGEGGVQPGVDLDDSAAPLT